MPRVCCGAKHRPKVIKRIIIHATRGKRGLGAITNRFTRTTDSIIGAIGGWGIQKTSRHQMFTLGLDERIRCPCLYIAICMPRIGFGAKHRPKGSKRGIRRTIGIKRGLGARKNRLPSYTDQNRTRGRGGINTGGRQLYPFRNNIFVTDIICVIAPDIPRGICLTKCGLGGIKSSHTRAIGGKRGDNTCLNRFTAKRPCRAKCGLSIAYTNIVACTFGRMLFTACTNNRKISHLCHGSSIASCIPRGRLCRANRYPSGVKRDIRRAIRKEWILTTGKNRLCTDSGATIGNSCCVRAITRQFTALVANGQRVH